MTSAKRKGFYIDVESSGGIALTFDECFPDGWPEDQPDPTAQDVIKALQRYRSKADAIREWYLDTEPTIVVTSAGNPQDVASW